MTPLFRRFVVVLALLAGGGAPAWAHAGHDEDAPAPSGIVQSRVETESAELELVAIVQGGSLVIYLDRADTNLPVTGAAIDVSADDKTGKLAMAQPDGTYRIEADWLAVPGRHDLLFAITAGETSDLLTATLTIPAPAELTTPAAAPGWQNVLAARKAILTPSLAFLLGVLGALAFQLRGRLRVMFGGVALLAMLLLGGVAFAEAPAVFEAPRRLADGSVFMPKPSQRLLALRTMVATESDAAHTVQVIGHVTADPNAAGRVQATQTGIVEPGAAGLAFLGKQVRKGDILAEVAPSIGQVERGTVGSTMADIDQQIRLGEQRLARLTALAGSVPGKDIDEARGELEAARRRRAAVGPTLVQRELLRAPVSGVVSLANAVTGQVVDSRDVLFEIVDPERLWVEALAFDPALATQVRSASALTAQGVPLALRLVGRGLAQRQGAIPLAFAIAAPVPPLGLGAPVTVILDLPDRRRGIVIPRGAVVRLPNGGAAVWNHVSAERFVTRPVRVEPLDGARMLVLAGVKPEQRIVTEGADLLSQVC